MVFGGLVQGFPVVEDGVFSGTLSNKSRSIRRPCPSIFLFVFLTNAGLYRARIQSDITTESVGPVSVTYVIVTFTQSMITGDERVATIVGPPRSVQPLQYDDTVSTSVALSNNSSIFLTIPGFSELHNFSNEHASSRCLISTALLNQTNYSFEVFENVTIGSVVFQAYDLLVDLDASSIVRFSLLTGVPFSINSSSGEVSTTTLLDRELGGDEYVIRFHVEELTYPYRQNTSELIATIIDINDSPPVFVAGPNTGVLFTSATENSTAHYSLRVLQGVPAGTEVLRVLAVDADLSHHGRVLYRPATNVSGYYNGSAFQWHQNGSLVKNDRYWSEHEQHYELLVEAVCCGLTRSWIVYLYLSCMSWSWCTLG